MEQVFVFKVDQKTVVNRNVIEAPVAGVHQTIQLHCNIYISKLKYKKCVQPTYFGHPRALILPTRGRISIFIKNNEQPTYLQLQETREEKLKSCLGCKKKTKKNAIRSQLYIPIECSFTMVESYPY